MKLKMVKGKTFMCPPIFGSETVIVPGQEVDVPDDKAQFLLDETFSDPSNNIHHYFEEVVDRAPVKSRAPKPAPVEAEEEEPEEGSDAEASVEVAGVKASVKSRRR